MDESFLDEILTTNIKSKKATFTIKSDILDDFRKIAKAKKYNQSKIIENLVKKFVEVEKSLGEEFG